jgi:hypothetical protein
VGVKRRLRWWLLGLAAVLVVPWALWAYGRYLGWIFGLAQVMNVVAPMR